MQYSETHSLRKDARFILTSSEVLSRLQNGWNLVKSFILTRSYRARDCLFLLSDTGCGVERVI